MICWELLFSGPTIFSLDFTLDVYKLHTQYFSDLTFLPRELSYLRRFRKVLPVKVKEMTLSEKITLAEYTLEFLTLCSFVESSKN